MSATVEKIKIHVTGDAYWAIFFMRPGHCFLRGIEGGQARAHLFPVGMEYIYRAIEAACAPQLFEKDDRDFIVTRKRSEEGQSVPVALYEIVNAGTMADYSDEKVRLPVLRLVRSETQEIALEGIPVPNEPIEDSSDSTNPEVLAHWFGELAFKGATRPNPRESLQCRVHIQVGLPSPFDIEDEKAISPAQVAKPTYARIIVVNIGELSAGQRIRRSLSYEAIAVDLLRFLRGTNEKEECKRPLQRLSMTEDGAAPLSVLAVRLNNSAVFLYACNWSDAKANGSRRFVERGAWLLCHKKECAPLSEPELGQMVGYTGFVTAQVVAAVAGYLQSHCTPSRTDGNEPQVVDSSTIQLQPAKDPDQTQLLEAVIAGVRRSLAWQRISFDRGCVHMLFRKSKAAEGEKPNWVATSKSEQTEAHPYYTNLFVDLVRTLDKEYADKRGNPQPGAGIADRIARYDQGFEDDVLNIPIDIKRAVAHRTQWFMARPIVSRWDPTKSPAFGDSLAARDLDDKDLKDRFQQVALSWLCEPPRTFGGPAIPIVHIGKAELTDRREVEDYLALYQALSVYADAREGKPLSIAVFGSPGSGKSYAVRQVVQYLSETKQNRYKRDPLTFNMGQFKSLDDFPAALHLVRNECLSREIPIVFFDEFDSSFQGQPFGWLKFFLAPMQDGEFYHAGQNYKLSNAVFVFAGGVNRSFEELNGRMRNPGFCEAKGPDFISRLKAHLNVQGINESEDEADQSRYILRRGILLRSMARRQLKLKDEEIDQVLLHRSVANALLTIPRFKHGVRSLEAIIKMCATRPGHPIGPSDLPSMDQLEMHVDAMKLLGLVDKYSRLSMGSNS